MCNNIFIIILLLVNLSKKKIMSLWSSLLDRRIFLESVLIDRDIKETGKKSSAVTSIFITFQGKCQATVPLRLESKKLLFSTASHLSVAWLLKDVHWRIKYSVGKSWARSCCRIWVSGSLWALAVLRANYSVSCLSHQKRKCKHSNPAALSIVSWRLLLWPYAEYFVGRVTS